MTSKPIISICIPTHHRKKELKETLDSITCQLHGGLENMVEIVICDDVSTDGTQQMVEYEATIWPQIKYIRNQKNMRFATALIANTYATGEYLLQLSDDDYLTPFSLSYIIDIARKTQFDFMIHKPLFTPDVYVDVEKTPNTFHLFHGISDFLTYIDSTEKEYKYLVSYLSFNSIMVIKASYRHHAYNNIDKNMVFINEFPQEFPPYYNLTDKVIVFPDSTMVKGRVLNAQYNGTIKLIKDFHTVVDFIETQNNIAGLQARESIKKVCVRGWTRTMILGIILKKLRLDYKKNGFVRRLYFLYKKYLQK